MKHIYHDSKRALSVLAILLIINATASARESDAPQAMDDLVVTSSKMDRKPEHMTDSVTIINEEEINLKGYTDITEILRLSPSVEFKKAGGPGQYSYPKLRGYGQGHFLVLVNGMKINEAYSAGVGNFLGHLDTKLVESVEILRGPQSALYGSDTTAGVMSFTTIGGKPGTHFNIGGEYGSLGWKKGYSTLRGGSRKLDYGLGLSYIDSDGVHDQEYFKDFSPTFNVGWHPGDLDVELAYIYIKSEFQAAELDEPNQTLSSRDEHWSFQTPDPNGANEYEHHVATLNLSHRISEALNHKMVLGWFEKEQYRNDLDDGLLGYQTAPFDNFTFGGVTYNQGDAVPVYDGGTGEAYGYDHRNLMADYNLLWDSRLGNTGSNATLFGVEYMYQEGGKWGRYGDLTSDTYNYSFYINNQMLLLDETLILSAGLRRDEHEAYGGKTTGKLGSAYNFTTTQTTLFANYGTSFRAPTFFNLYDAVYGNEDIEPESGWTVEGGLRQSWAGGRINAEVTYWYSELEDVIIFDYSIPNPASSVGSGKYANNDAAETSGVEVAFGAWIADQINLQGNYTYTDSYTEKDGEQSRTVQIARNKGSLTLSYLSEKLNAGVSGYYAGPRLRWKGDIEMEAYFRVDVFGRFHLTDKLDLYGRIENLLDEDIEEGLGYEQPGFYGIIGMEFKLSI